MKKKWDIPPRNPKLLGKAMENDNQSKK